VLVVAVTIWGSGLLQLWVLAIRGGTHFFLPHHSSHGPVKQPPPRRYLGLVAIYRCLSPSPPFLLNTRIRTHQILKECNPWTFKDSAPVTFRRLTRKYYMIPGFEPWTFKESIIACQSLQIQCSRSLSLSKSNIWFVQFRSIENSRFDVCPLSVPRIMKERNVYAIEHSPRHKPFLYSPKQFRKSHVYDISPPSTYIEYFSYAHSTTRLCECRHWLDTITLNKCALPRRMNAYLIRDLAHCHASKYTVTMENHNCPIYIYIYIY